MTRPEKGPDSTLGKIALAPLVGLACYGAAGWISDRTAGRAGWQLVNYRGVPVSLAAGPALAAGALGVRTAARGGGRLELAVLAAAAAGRYDDLGHDPVRGLAGHLRTLATGRLTRGVVKLLVLPAAGWLAADRAGATQRGADAVLIAAVANLINLLDVRPGRALKVVGLAAAALVASGGGSSSSDGDLAMITAAAAASLLGGDLAERWLLGDCGAAAAGTLLGSAVIHRVPGRGRWRLTWLLAGLTLLAERVSLSRMIACCPPLRALDDWGRRSPG